MMMENQVVDVLNLYQPSRAGAPLRNSCAACLLAKCGELSKCELNICEKYCARNSKNALKLSVCDHLDWGVVNVWRQVRTN